MRVAVVGAGVVGLCTALSLARRDVEVVVFDPADPGSGPSATNAGWIVPSLAGPLPGPGLLARSLTWLLRRDSPLWIRPRLDPRFIRFLWTFRGHMNASDYRAGLEATLELARGTMPLLDQLAGAGVEFEMHRDGVVMAYTSRRAYEAGLHELESLDGFGYAAGQRATGDGVTEIDPALGPGVAGAFVVDGERHVDPVSFNAAILRELTRFEVEVARTAVQRLERANGRVDISLANGETRAADALVIAAGASAGRVSAMLGVPLPVEAGKGYCVDLAPPPIALRRPLYLHEERIAVTPLSSRLRLAGTMELGARSTSLSMTRIRAIERGARRLLTGWDQSASSVTYGSGLRPVTPDGLPLIGPLPGMANVWVAGGHAMMGLTLGPVTGEVVATGLLEGAVADVVRPFLPGRFTTGHV